MGGLISEETSRLAKLVLLELKTPGEVIEFRLKWVEIKPEPTQSTQELQLPLSDLASKATESLFDAEMSLWQVWGSVLASTLATVAWCLNDMSIPAETWIGRTSIKVISSNFFSMDQF